MKRSSNVPIRRSRVNQPVQPKWWKQHGDAVIAAFALCGVVLGLASVLWKLGARA